MFCKVLEPGNCHRFLFFSLLIGFEYNLLMKVASFFSRAMIKMIGFGWKEGSCRTKRNLGVSATDMVGFEVCWRMQRQWQVRKHKPGA